MSSWLAFVPLFIAPADTPSATAHQRAHQPRVEQRAATKPLAAAAETPKSVWRIDTSGSATHWQSTMICPAATRSFQRTELVSFDGFGLDVGCNFDRPAGDAVISTYLTRRKGESLNDHFAQSQNALKQDLPGAKPLTGDLPAPTGLAFVGALYELSDGVRSGLWAADVSGWTFEIRATYVPASQAEVLEVMSDLAQKARATAGAHLAACAAAPPVQRTGTQITDADRLTGLSIFGALGAVSDEDGKDLKIAEQWCVEDPAGDSEMPMLFWRNIANNGNIGAMDRISIMTIKEPPVLLSEANPIASLLDDKAEKSKVLIHQLTIVQGDTTHIFAFYDGRPNAATIAPLVKDLALSKRGPLVSYSRGSNTITIPMSDAKPGS